MAKRPRRSTPCRRLNCGHESCDRRRHEAASPCSVCREPIGDSGYIAVPADESEFAPLVLTHTLCAAKEQLITEKEHYP